MKKGGNFSDCVIFSRMSKQILCRNVCCKVRVAKFSEAAKDLERHTMSTGATPAADEVKKTLLKRQGRCTGAHQWKIQSGNYRSLKSCPKWTGDKKTAMLIFIHLV